MPCITKLARHNRLFGNFKFPEVFFFLSSLDFYLFLCFSKPKPKKTKKRMKDWAGVGRKGGRGAERARPRMQHKFFFFGCQLCVQLPGVVPGQDLS